MILTIAALPMRTHASIPTIVFSEIAWAGSSISSSDEWIELTNVSDETLNLSGWKITGAGSSESDLVFPEESLIEPHSTYLISNYALTHENTALGTSPNFTTATLSLPNGGFRLALYDDENTLIDLAGADGSPFAGRSGSTADSNDGRYASMERVDGLADGSLATSWSDAHSSQGFLEGVEDYGTPGIVSFASQTDGEDLVEEVFSDSITMRINEFVVDPLEDEHEWIELMNERTEEIDLTGWTVEDAVGKQTLLDGIIQPGAYYLIDAPLGKLNNDADSIVLKNASGELIDSLIYGTDELPAPKDGSALARNSEGVFELTYQPTPGMENLIDTQKPEILEEEIVEVNVEDGLTQETESIPQEEVSVEVLEEEPTEKTDTVSSVDQTIELRISEFVVDPLEGGIEWIELFNASSVDALLTGYVLEDASGKSTHLSAFTILADSYLVIESPKGKLNNDGDTVTLKNGAGEILESVTYGVNYYPVPRNGNALARNGDTFELTQIPTPGKPNLIFIAIESIDEIPVTSAIEVVPVATESSTEIPESDPEPELLKTVRFVTLYPNTTGSDETEEYIEIQNTGLEPVDLNGWLIEDGSTDTYTFKETTTIFPGETIRLYRTDSKLTLNNTGDTLELLAPDAEIVDKVTYGNAAKGVVYTYANSLWSWSATASSQAVASPTSRSASATKTSVSSSKAQPAISVTIAEAKTRVDGTDVHVTGVITALPGVFGAQIFYLEDSTGGIQIYLYSGEYPNLALGNTVEVTGVLSTSRGERRIKLAGTTGAVPASARLTLPTNTYALTEVNPSLTGTLLSTSGQIQSKSATKLILEQSGATLTIYLNSTPAIDPNQFERGDQMTITGVLTSYDGELRLRPRTIEDMAIEEEALMASSTTTHESTKDAGSAGIILLLITIVVLGLLALWHFVPRRRLTPATT